MQVRKQQLELDMEQQTDWLQIGKGVHQGCSQNFPEFIVIHTVKGVGIVNKAELDVFLELLLFQ